MLRMRRTSLVRACAFAAGILAFAAVPALASIIELGGQTTTGLIAPKCPPGPAANCKIVLDELTAIETVRDGTKYPTTVKKSGWLVAWTIGLSILSPDPTTERKYIHQLDHNYGGTTRAQIVVLKPVGPHRQFKWQMVAAGPIVHLQPYLGSVAQLVLPKPIRVLKGEVIGLNVPTWVPVLSINLSTKSFAYRQSRSTSCQFAPGQSGAPAPVNQVLGTTVAYGCDYPGTRIEYSATEVTDPVKSNTVR